jgi:hypothetical protein
LGVVKVVCSPHPGAPAGELSFYQPQETAMRYSKQDRDVGNMFQVIAVLFILVMLLKMLFGS